MQETQRERERESESVFVSKKTSFWVQSKVSNLKRIKCFKGRETEALSRLFTPNPRPTQLGDLGTARRGIGYIGHPPNTHTSTHSARTILSHSTPVSLSCSLFVSLSNCCPRSAKLGLINYPTSGTCTIPPFGRPLKKNKAVYKRSPKKKKKKKKR